MSLASSAKPLVAPAAANAGLRRSLWRERPEPVVRVAPLWSATGELIGEVELDRAHFGIVPNVAVMHQVVTAQLAARRSGTHSVKRRHEVSGGGAKPYRQKGTGRARQGSIRAPQFVGGAVAHGPKPRSYRQRTPKKMVRLALCSALSDRAALNRVVVVDAWRFEVPRTKDAVRFITAAGLAGRLLVVVEADDWSTSRSFANLPHVHVLPAGELNAYDVLRADWVVFSETTLPGPHVVRRLEASEPPESSTGDAVAVDDSGSSEAEDDAGSSEADELAGEVDRRSSPARSASSDPEEATVDEEQEDRPDARAQIEGQSANEGDEG
jgi:large subunit ribosomal protein L4